MSKESERLAGHRSACADTGLARDGLESGGAMLA